MLSQHWGLFDISNRTDKPLEWPRKGTIETYADKLRSHKVSFNPGVFGYKCDVSNHSRTDVLDVALPIRFWFGNATGDSNAITYTPVISPLDAGSHFTFYVFNDCAIHVSGILPDRVSFTAPGENTRRAAQLYLPHRSPIEPFMLFFPSDVQWVRQQPCD